MLLTTPVQFLKGVGPRLAARLEQLGIRTLRDLLWHLPTRYVDRRAIAAIQAVDPGKDRVIVGTVVASGIAFLGRRRTRVFELLVSDDTGTLSAKWFHCSLPAMQRRFPKGTRVLLAGELTVYGGVKQFIHPDIELLHDEGAMETGGKILPIYPSTEGITQRQWRRFLWEAWDQVGDTVTDLLPEALRMQRHLLPLSQALAWCHFPPADATMAALHHRRTPAWRTLIFDECLVLELGLALRRAGLAQEQGVALPSAASLCEALRAVLPFVFTAAQERVLAEIRADLERPRPMHRLVQGDVGSGKTVVALAAALQTIAAGYQVAFMAPTEVLAEQHARTLGRWLDTLRIPWAVLTAAVKGKVRQSIYARTASGDCPFLIGTQALLEDPVHFARLALVIIDEQQRFGVVQRLQLKQKGMSQPHSGGEGEAPPAVPVEGATRAPLIDEQQRFGVVQRLQLKQKGMSQPHSGATPHLLIMSATPIPRTLAMTVYGDLDISVIDQLPAGRQPIITKVYSDRQRPQLYDGMRKELARGRQMYVVYPLVEESENVDLKNATAMAEVLRDTFHPTYRVALLHGRMRSEEKEGIMRGFQAGEIHILATTSVVEVGVDIPNATVMIIEHAERFGLAQLHQLRGRVGRGAHQSYCILIGHSSRSETAAARLRIMTETTDGFRIAEEDLRLRGPGELLGARQSGLPELRVADLIADRDLMAEARAVAADLLRDDPQLVAPGHHVLREAVLTHWGNRLELGKVG